MLAKIMKFQAIKPRNMLWEVFENILRHLRQDTRHIKNKTIQLYWEYQGFSSKYKEKYGVYPRNR